MVFGVKLDFCLSISLRSVTLVFLSCFGTLSCVFFLSVCTFGVL
ncbi:unnamed protein product [Schistosoma curassoni]|uniref:Uncharacterized protein n=1 Tax=Schistosoma curassoni TaxID=6186 RepID=A0A183K2A4_9TREM|nr:unnamed protein product [Schistosoma curassoni]